MELKEIYVENFKSLKESRIIIEKFNVIVGANASGKSNFVEVFKLLKKIYVERVENPFIEWWGYKNVVFEHKEELPIKISLKFEDKYEILYYEIEITGSGGTFEIIKETFRTTGGLIIEKTRNMINIGKHKIYGSIRLIEYPNPYKYPDKLLYFDERSFEDVIRDAEEQCNELQSKLKDLPYGKEYIETKIRYETLNQSIIILKEILDIDLLHYFNKLKNFIENIVILKDVNVTEIKPPINPKKETKLEENGRNLVNILYNLFLESGKIPDEINTIISYIFPKTSIRFELTQDGRVLMKIFENNLELLPPSISSGFLKFLTIITAIQLNPSLIIIDEIENSLHPKAIELLIGEFKNSKSQVIVTTHSPIVVDMIYPDINSLILVKKENNESSFHKIENAEKIRKELDEEGITLSEKWLYGRIDKK